MWPSGFPREWKKCSFYLYCFLPWLFDRKWKYNFKECKTKPFEIILHLGVKRVTSFQVGWLKNPVTVKTLQMNILFLTTLPTLKACNSPYMQYYFKRLFVLHSSEVIFSFLIKKSRQKAIEIEIAFFSFPCEYQGSHNGSFLFDSHIDTYIDELVEIFLKLINENRVVHLIIGTTLDRYLMFRLVRKDVVVVTLDPDKCSFVFRSCQDSLQTVLVCCPQMCLSHQELQYWCITQSLMTSGATNNWYLLDRTVSAESMYNVSPVL